MSDSLSHSCPTCGGTGKVEGCGHGLMVSHVMDCGTRATYKCPDCIGGYPKAAVERATKAAFTAYFGDPDTQGNERYNPLDEKEWEPVALAAIRAFHNEGNKG